MIQTEKFCGNQKNVHYLNKILEKGFVSHAYLFEGPEHVGKTTLALRFAAELLGDSFENVLRNPDLIFVSPDKEEKQISVDTVRELQKNLSLYPYKAKYKVALIEKTEFMNRTAANSLLKTLEEPGQTSIIILITSDSEKILDTIKSRCQILNFNIVSSAAIESFLGANNKKSEDKEAVELSQGKPGVAISLLEDIELLNKVKKGKEEILRFFNYNNFEKMEKAVPIHTMEKEEVIGVLDLWISTLRKEMLVSVDDKEITRVKKIKNAIDKIISVRKDILENNVNLRLAIENLCLSF